MLCGEGGAVFTICLPLVQMESNDGGVVQILNKEEAGPV